MLEQRIQGSNLNEIAAEFRVSRRTVERTLSWAKKAELIVEIEDKILQELVPAAHSAILAALTDTDNPQEAGKLALELFKGTVPGFGKTKPKDSGPGNPSDELSRYIEQFRTGEGVINGSVADSPLLFDPSAAKTADAERLSLPAGGDGDGDGAEAVTQEVLGGVSGEGIGTDAEGGDEK